MSDKISTAILAGGQSSRMGRNKALLPVGGIPIIERVIARVRDLTQELVIITNMPDIYRYLDLPMFADVVPGKATLGGLYTAIQQTGSEHTLVVSCDQPFLNPQLLRYLIDLRHEADVIVPLDHEDYPQSMHAVYSKACLAPIRRRLDEDRLKVIGFFDDVRVRRVSTQEIDRFDPSRYSFINVNTPEELAEAEQLARLLG